MSRRVYIIFIASISACSSYIAPDLPNNCDTTQCPGPLYYYYEELGCIPIFSNASNCCPTSYNCDRWKNMPRDKCFADGKYYNSGEVFSMEISQDPCITCSCTSRSYRPSCSLPGCVGPKLGCYYRKTPWDCCGGVEICPEKEEDIPTCIVDGKTYKEGEMFRPLENPQKICYCQEGYSGTNVEPFCRLPRPSWCGNTIFHSKEIEENCAPVYSKEQSLHNSCPAGFRCQEAIDHQNENGKAEVENLDTLCKFGNLTLAIGETLVPLRRSDSIEKCVCEIPPILTCRSESTIVA